MKEQTYYSVQTFPLVIELVPSHSELDHVNAK
jgi:hypothetical protein